MKRRTFLKNIAPLAAAPMMLNGIPVRSMASPMMNQAFTCQEVSERILVLVQLHGGNDGLNTMVPINQYNTYQTLRPDLALPNTGSRSILNLDTTLPLADQVGLHPDLTALKSLYDDGKMSILQGAGYANNNKSHFKAKDDWMTGSDTQNSYTSGWMGRYLDHVYPNYPQAYPNPQMLDPLGLELGSRTISLGFHRDGTGTTGLALAGDPGSFYTLISNVGGVAPSNIPSTHYGSKLSKIVDTEFRSNAYAQRINTVFNNGINAIGVTYPATHYAYGRYHQNELTPQLQTVARLISGGSQTKIYLVRLTGFDTHVNQVTSSDPTVGEHAQLIYNLFEALKAFQSDLEAQGLDDKVLTVTFSEFGRRAAQNGGLGTDHGTYAPMFIMGSGVEPGIMGANPNLNNLTGNNISTLQYDYRAVFTTVIQDWLGGSNQALVDANFNQFQSQKIPFLNTNYVADASCYMAPFPVGLLDFQANLQADATVLCQWSTANEVNSDRFIIERSANGEQYEELGVVPGAGNTSQTQSYNLPDFEPYRGLSYYRLKQIDVDGTFTYYPAVNVFVPEEVHRLTVKAFPNPATEYFTIEMNSAVAIPAKIHIHTLQGALLHSFPMQLERGDNQYKVDARDLSAGIYLISVVTRDGESANFKQLIR